jgi:hypothetical protein
VKSYKSTTRRCTQTERNTSPPGAFTKGRHCKLLGSRMHVQSTIAFCLLPVGTRDVERPEQTYGTPVPEFRAADI